VGLKRKGAEWKVEQRIVMEDTEEGLVAPLELSNRVMEGTSGGNGKGIR
jgi:hypothetical protein